jgi:hypothetical protein
LTIATRIAVQVSADPSTFASVAQKESEDVVTSAAGGSLGGVRAANLMMDSQVLDVLAALHNGEVSRPVETRHGFHIFLRRSPPPLTVLAARRIVVPYDGVAPAAPVGRTRQDAEAIARAIAEDLRADADRFAQYLTKYPPPPGADPRGAIGIWTSQEPGRLEREREQLAGLPIGGVTDPIDSPDGFGVLMRTVAGEPQYSVELIKLPFREGTPASDPASHSSSLKLAHNLLKSLATDPGAFESLQRQYCCRGIESWSRGRVTGGLIDGVSRLPIAGISPTPLESPPYLLIAKRVDPELHPLSVLELPAPKTVDLRRIATASSGTAVQRLIQDLGGKAAQSLGLADGDRQRVAELHGQLAQAFADGEANTAREQALDLFAEGMRGLLTPEQYEAYRTMASDAISARMMDRW